MEQTEREKYLKAYYDNEADANKQMSIANAVAGGFLIVVWILYLVGVLEVHTQTLWFVGISFPLIALNLLSPLMFMLFHKKSLHKSNYKFFVVFSFIFAVALINIIIPKHGILAWALCILMVNHYYNPKFGRIVFGVVMGLMLICMYAGMFVGEYDPNLLGVNKFENNSFVIDGIVERFNMLKDMLARGENRYLKVFLYYYLSRGAILTLIFLVANSLNTRTYKLLVKEINVSNEQSKTKTELEVAKEIQINTLPVELVANKDVEIQAELKAAKEVGGDFYDYFLLDDDHVAILIADVSGKGIPAAMLMMKTITCFRNYLTISRTPAQIMKLVNKVVYQGNNNSMFVTAFLAIVNTKTGEVKFSNAGHNPPLIGSNKNFRYLKCNSGFVLGGLEEAFVMDETFTLQNGEQITLYTDGITEAMNNKREQYGEQRFLEFANHKEFSCLLEFHHDLKDDVYKFVDGAEQSDDMTYITLKYHGDEFVYEDRLFTASKEEVPNILKFFEDFGKKHNFEEKFVKDTIVVGDELISNIVKFGYEKETENGIYIRLLYNLDKKELVMTIIDQGKPFDPFAVDNKPLDIDNFEDRAVGGLGILIVKKLMSEYAYDRLNDKNIITLKKQF